MPLMGHVYLGNQGTMFAEVVVGVLAVDAKQCHSGALGPTQSQFQDSPVFEILVKWGTAKTASRTSVVPRYVPPNPPK